MKDLPKPVYRAFCPQWRGDAHTVLAALRHSCMGPHDQRCCCLRYASYELGSSLRHVTSCKYTKRQPWQYARSERSTAATRQDGKRNRTIRTVLHRRPGQPSARLLDARATPHARCPVKVEETSRRNTRELLACKMVVERNRLHDGKYARELVRVHPARLDESYVRVVNKV